MANIRYTTYQQYLNTLGGLINWPTYTALPATQVTALQSYYNNNASDGWIKNNWLNVCPQGEARFVGNLGQYPNDLSNTTYWTATNLTATANNLANPADGRVTATKLLETVTNATHKALQTLTYIPNATYQITCYARPIGGRYLYLSANDGVNTYSTFFNIVSGTVGTQSNNLSSTSSMTQTANGFWVCSIFFTADSGAGAGNFGPACSSDGSTLSYAGDTAKGLYVWGNVASQTTYAAPTSLLIPYDQLGESFIDAVFQVYQYSPVGAGFPVPQGYELMPDGIQVIGTNAWVWNGWLWTFPSWYTAGWPLFLYYRQGCPSYSGASYSTTTSYTVDTQILYSDTSGNLDFWKCTVATSANESPDSAPTKWTELKLPEFLFLWTVYKSCADYYRMDAQHEKAAQLDAQAQGYLDTQSDKQERQQGVQPPLRAQTHISAQARAWPTR